MIISTKYIAAVAVAFVVIASPSFAHKGGLQMSAARAAAIHECNTKAEKYTITTWGNTQLQVYRACMAEHHQVE